MVLPKPLSEVVRNSISNFNKVIEDAQAESNSNLQKFLINYALQVNKLESETIIVFREIFHNRANSTILDEMISSVQLKFNKTALKISKEDSNYINKDEILFNERLNIFTSLVVIEVIRKALLPSHITDKKYSQWIESNIKLIFPDIV